jgi:hypothetical protein
MGPQGPAGERGADGLTGPQGAQGPQGLPGGGFLAERSWVGAFPLAENLVWFTIPNSTVTFTSKGGPVLINVDVALYTEVPQYGSCKPIVDDRWAGEYAGYPGTDNWIEGLRSLNPGWLPLTKSRVYTAIPAGEHTLAIQCLKYSDHSNAVLVGSTTVWQSISAIELH